MVNCQCMYSFIYICKYIDMNSLLIMKKGTNKFAFLCSRQGQKVLILEIFKFIIHEGYFQLNIDKILGL